MSSIAISELTKIHQELHTANINFGAIAKTNLDAWKKVECLKQTNSPELPVALLQAERLMRLTKAEKKHTDALMGLLGEKTLSYFLSGGDMHALAEGVYKTNEEREDFLMRVNSVLLQSNLL